MAGKIEMARGVAGGRLAWVAEGGLEGGYMGRVTPRAPTRPPKGLINPLKALYGPLKAPKRGKRPPEAPRSPSDHRVVAGM